MVFGYLYLAQTETNPPAIPQNLCFNIRFHLYIHDHVLDEPIGTVTSRANTYVPLDIGIQLHLMVFGYLFLFTRMESNPPPQNLCFNLYIYYND